MAENKKSFLLYCDLIHTIEKMPLELAGELFLHILKYVNDKNPISENLLINLTFEPIKQSLKRDLIKYEKICNRNKDNGSKGGRPKNPDEPKKPSGLITNPDEPKKPDNDSDSVNDSDKDKKEKTIKIGGAKKAPQPDFVFCKDFWLSEFRLGFTFDGANGKALKNIISKMKTVMKAKGSEITDVSILETFKLICFNLPEWFQDKDLLVINSKFNEILIQIKNKNNGTITTKDSNGRPISKYAPKFN